MSDIAIVILNFNSTPDTIDCIQSLKKANHLEKTTFIIVDNHSEKEHVDMLKSFIEKENDSRIHPIYNTANSGFSGGNNVGITYALERGAEYILILNNDTYVEKGFMKPLVDQLEQNDSTGVVVPKIYFAKGCEFHKDRYSQKDLGKVIWYAGGEIDWDNCIGHHRGVDEVDTGQFEKTEKTEFATGACFLAKASVFKEVGMFDDKFFLYYEDSDLSMRVMKSGKKIVYVPKSVIWHKNAGSTGGSGSNLQDYFLTRNRMLFGFRYAPFRTKVALLRESMQIMRTGRDWQKRGIADFYRGKFGKGGYPVKD